VEGSLSGTVGADYGDRLAFLDRDIDAKQRLEVAIKRRKILRAQQGHDAGIPM
jgi:hypothetical protein